MDPPYQKKGRKEGRKGRKKEEKEGGKEGEREGRKERLLRKHQEYRSVIVEKRWHWVKIGLILNNISALYYLCYLGQKITFSLCQFTPQNECQN